MVETTKRAHLLIKDWESDDQHFPTLLSASLPVATLSTRGFILRNRPHAFGRSHEMTETGNRAKKSPFHPGYLSNALVKQNLQLSKVALSFTFLDFSPQALAPNDPYTLHDDWDTNRCILRVFNQYISRLQDTCHRSCCGARVRVAKVSKNSTVKFF